MNIGGGAGPRHSGESWLVGEIVPNGGVIIDVGANEGQYAEEVLNAMPDARLYCLEPSPEAFSALSSRLANRPVQIFNVGLSSRAGELNLYGEPGSPLGSVYQRRLDHFGLSSYHSVSVQVLPLDAFWSGQTGTVIDLLKLDAEGHELQILQGAKRLLAGRMIRAIQFEFGGANIDSRTFFQDYWYLLKDEYSIFRILPHGLREIKKYEELDEQFATTNFLALAKWIEEPPAATTT